MISFSNHVRYKSGDDFCEGNNGKSDKGVGDHVFGFLGFARVAAGSDIGNATVDYKDSRDDAGNANHPLDGFGDHGARVLTFGESAVFGKIDVSKGNADRIKDDISGHDDGEAKKGLIKGFFTSSNFARVAARESI